MAAIDREAPLRFLETAFEPEDWAAIFLKSYESGRVAQRVGPVTGLAHPRFQAWLRARNAERFNIYVRQRQCDQARLAVSDERCDCRDPACVS